MSSEQHRIDGALECREATGSPGRLVGVVSQSAEWPGIVRSCSSVAVSTTPSDGIALLPEHRSATVVMTFDPIRRDRWLTTS